MSSIFSVLLNKVSGGAIPIVDFRKKEDVKAVIDAAGIAKAITEHAKSWLDNEVLIITPEITKTITDDLVAASIITPEEKARVSEILGPIVGRYVGIVEAKLEDLISHEIP